MRYSVAVSVMQKTTLLFLVCCLVFMTNKETVCFEATAGSLLRQIKYAKAQPCHALIIS